MGVSTGQIFQPKLMQSVEPQRRESAWEQVLPNILSSVAQTAVNSYIKNKLTENQQEQEMLAKGYTKNPDGTWSPPAGWISESSVPGVLQYGQGSATTGFMADPALKKDKVTSYAEMAIQAKQQLDSGAITPEQYQQRLSEIKQMHGATTGVETAPSIISGKVDAQGNPQPDMYVDYRTGEQWPVGTPRPSSKSGFGGGASTQPTGGFGATPMQTGVQGAAAPPKKWGLATEEGSVGAKTFSPTNRGVSVAAPAATAPIASPQSSVVPPVTATPTTTQGVVTQAQQRTPGFYQPQKETGADASRKYQDIEMRRELGRPLTPEDEAFSKAYEKEKTLASEARITAYTKLGENFTNWDNDTKYTAFERKLYGENPDFGTGVGAVNNKSTFEKEYNQWLQRVGLSGKESLATRADFKADTSSLLQATKTLDSISSFGRGAKESFGLITDLANDYKNGKFPGVNKWNQVFDYYIGDPKVKALQNAVQTSMLEYMKVTTAGSGVTAAELSVRAQETAANLLKSHDNPETMKKAIETFRKEIDIVEDARKEQKKQILARMKSAESTDGSTTPAPVPAPAAAQFGGNVFDKGGFYKEFWRQNQGTKSEAKLAAEAYPAWIAYRDKFGIKEE